MAVLDANKNELCDGDSVVAIKDLKVKGAGATLKRGTKISGIKLNGKDGEFEAKVPKMGALVLRSEFFKKA